MSIAVVVLSLALIVLILTLLVRTETFADPIRATAMDGAIQLGGGVIQDAKLQPSMYDAAWLSGSSSKRCMQQCARSVQDSAFEDETNADERMQLCYAMC